MKFTKLTFGIIGIMIIMLVLITINVQASNSLKATLNTSINEIKKGEEVVITLKLDEYQGIKKGINAYKAKLEYDKNIFEEVKEKDFICQNNWEQLKYNKDTGEFVAIKKVGSKVPEEIVKITLKAKEEVKAGTTDVIAKEIVTSEGEKDIDLDETKVTINIIEEQEEKPEDPDKPEKITSQKYKIESSYISRIVPKTTVAEFRKNVTLENVTTIPQMVFTDEAGNILQDNSLIKTGTKLKVGKTLEYTLIIIGDIDKDSEIAIGDLAAIKLHLIENKLLTGIELIAADIDEDTKVTINDLAKMKLILIGLLEIK